MRVRIRFTKEGNVKYIGHLDVMRYFQKLMRRAKIPIAYSAGMSPHQILSFALPLSIGEESIGEYADIELTGSVDSAKAVNDLMSHSTPGIRILSFRYLPDQAVNAMASVEAADYEVSFREFPESPDLSSAFSQMMDEPEITVLKKTKKSERLIDIRPFIFAWEVLDRSLRLRLKCGSVDNTKPELVVKALFEKHDIPFDPSVLMIKRLDLLTVDNGTFVSLDEIGRDLVT